MSESFVSGGNLDWQSSRGYLLGEAANSPELWVRHVEAYRAHCSNGGNGTSPAQAMRNSLLTAAHTSRLLTYLAFRLHDSW